MDDGAISKQKTSLLNKNNFLLFFGFALLFFTLATPVFGADIYWTNGNATGLWSDSANWSTASVPGSSDIVYFSASSTDDCTIDQDATVDTFNMIDGYTGTVTQSGSYNLTIDSVQFEQSDGTFVGGAGQLTTVVFNLSDGAEFYAPSTTQFSGTLSFGAGSNFYHSNGTVILANHNVNTYFEDTGVDFYNFILNGGYAKFTGQEATVNGALTLRTGRLTSGVINTKGSVVDEGDFGYSLQYGYIRFSGTNNVTTTFYSRYVASLIVENPNVNIYFAYSGEQDVMGLTTITSGTIHIDGNTVDFEKGLTINGDNAVVNIGDGTLKSEISPYVTQSAGTINCNSTSSVFVTNNYYFSGGVFNGSGTVNIGGYYSDFFEISGTAVFNAPSMASGTTYLAAIDSLGGTFNHNNGLVVLENGGTYNTDGNSDNNLNFYELNINNNGYSFGDDTLVAQSTTTINVGTSNRIQNGMLEMQGDLVINTLKGIRAHLKFSGGNDQYVSFDNLGVDSFYAGVNVYIDKSGGEVIMQSDILLDNSYSDLVITNGTLNMNGYDLTINGGNGNFLNNYGILKLKGSEVLTLDNGLETESEVVDSGTLEYIGDSDGEADTFYLEEGIFYNLKINTTDSNDIITASSSVSSFTLNGDLEITTSSIFYLGGADLSVTGDFSNNGTLRVVGSEYLGITNDTDSGTFEVVGDGDSAVDTYTNTLDFYNLKLNFTDNDDTFYLEKKPSSLFSGLVGYWGFEEGSGTTTADNSSYNNPGTFISEKEPTWSTDTPTSSFTNNYSLDFASGTQAVYIPSGNLPFGTEARTICLWMKPTSYDSWEYIFAYGHSWYFERIALYRNEDSLYVDTNASSVNTSNFFVKDQWSHACFTFEGGGDNNVGSAHLYEGNTSMVDGDLIVNTTGGGAYIGEKEENKGIGWHGGLDEIAVYDRVLTTDEMEDLSNGEGIYDYFATAYNDIEISNGNFSVLSTSRLDVGGDWLNTGGTFVPNNSTVNLNGTNQTISGENTFYNLSKVVSSTYTLTLPASATTTITGTTTWQGIDGASLNIRSSVTDTQTLMDPQGGRDVRYLNAKDNNNVNAEIFSCTVGCTDSGNLTNWTFVDPSIQVTIADVSVSESDGTATITATLSGTPSGDVTVDFYTSNNTALSGSDYTSVTGTLTWLSGTNGDVTTTISITNDILDELDETFYVNLENPVNTNISDDQATFTITDNDPPPEFFVEDATTAENAGTVSVSVSMTNQSGSTCTIDYATSNGTATAGSDYTATNDTLSWSSGEDGVKTFNVSITDDSISEVDETLIITISSQSCGSITDSTATVTISGNDGPPDVAISDASGAEDDGTIPVTVTLTGADNSTTTIDYAMSSGTATANSDFTSVTGTLTWSPGETGNKIISVSMLDDSLHEVDENFTITLSNGVNVDIDDGSATVIITNDESTPAFSVVDTSAAENNQVEVTVTMSGQSAYTATVNYVTAASSTATSGSDYTATNGTLSWSAGETGAKTFLITLIDDSIDEDAEEYFNVVLSSPNNGSISDGTGIIGILDNDGTPVLSMSDKSVSESNNASITVSMSGLSSNTTTVDYATTDITAVAGTDYTSKSGTLTWLAGETGDKTFTVVITSDSLDESNETVLITLSNDVNADLSNTTSTLTIQDNDPTPYFTASDVYAIESNGTSTASVYMNYYSAATATVDYVVEQIDEDPGEGEAEAGVDYVFTSGTLTWSPGETGSKTFDIGVLNDSLIEGQETANITLSNPTNATISDSSALLILDDDGTPAITITDKTVGENNTSFTATVTMSGTSANTTTVDWVTADNTASSGSDYTESSGIVTWNPGEYGEKTVSLSLTDDSSVEGSESFYINLSNVTGDASISDSQGEIIITDNDGLPSLSINDVSGAEGGSNLTFTVSKSGDIDQTVTVDWVTANNTATGGSDYTIASGTLTWEEGDSSDKEVVITITDDEVTEDDEYVYVLLNNAQNSSISDDSGTGTIKDNDTAVSLSISDATVSEGSGSVTITVTMSGYYSEAVSVDYDTSNSTALSGSDYTESTDTLTWSAGETGDKTFSVPIINDPLDESDETFGITLSNFNNCTTIDDNATVTIEDNDNTPSIGISDAIVNETAGTISVNITMTGQSASTVSVSYATANGTASSGSDYVAKSGVLTWSSGETGLQSIVVSITDDESVEGAENFNVNLSGVLNATISDLTGVVSVIDDDGTPFVYFNVATTTAGESDGTAFVAVVISGVPESGATVQYTTANGTASSGSDYTSVNGVLTWEAGSTSTKYISVPILSDSTEESDEVFTLSLSSPSGLQLGVRDSQSVVIDDDDGVLTLSVLDVSANEGADSVVITVSATGNNGSGASVDYVTSNNTALAGVDYYSVEGTLTWSADDTDDKTVIVNLYDDQINESSETFVFTLSNESNAYLSNTTSTITIADNDSPPSLSIVDAEVSEGVGSATISVVMNGYYDDTVSVSYGSSNGTATAGSDYTASSGSVSWSAGETGSQTFSIPITDDSSAESSEAITLTISSPANATISDNIAILTIIDNDTPGVSRSGTGLGTVTEGGSTYTYSLVLNTEPTDDAVVSISASSAQVGISPTALTFTNLNWDTVQNIIVTAIDDEEVEGSETLSISHVVASSDSDYDAYAISDISLSVVDNDVASGGAFLAPVPPVVSTTTQSILDSSVADGSPLAVVTRLTENVISLEFKNVENASEVAVSESKDFAGSSWVSYPTKKYNLKDKEADRLYFKFRSKQGATTPVFVSSIKLASAVKKTTETIIPTPTKKPIIPTVNYVFTSYLYIGSTGDEVRGLQRLLEQLGYYKYPTITGYFGNVTKQAVVDFQKDKGLTPYPGWVGPGTRKVLNGENGIIQKVVALVVEEIVSEKVEVVKDRFVFDRYMYLGSLGIQVRQLQQVLKDLGYFKHPQTTAYFGPVTKQAVMDFQKAKGLIPFPGWIGPQTRKALNSL